MGNKASLALAELLIMVLVFALAAAGCLRCFVWARITAEETAALDRAVALAQNTAEALQHSGGDLQRVQALVEIPQGLRLEYTSLPPQIPGLGEMEIAVMTEAGTELFRLTAAWQEDLT